MSEAEVLLEHANIMRKLASDLASQHLTLMLVGSRSPTNNLVRDTVGANRRSLEEAADHLQRLARGRRSEFVISRPRMMTRRRARWVAWIALALGIFTFAWAIGCAVVGAELAGQGPVFEPPSPHLAAAPALHHASR